MPSARLITLKDVSKRYPNGTLALSGINLTIRDGEFMSLLGPSGCGKSTMLRLIAGLGPATTGSIDWHDDPKCAAGERHAELGFVFQEPTLLPWATVSYNVYLPLKLAGMTRAAARQRVNDALAMVGLEQSAGLHPRQLSGGMKMRVSIARALVTQPRVLLLDEPFSALDEITRFRLNNDLLTLWRRQRWTVVFVTHSVFEAVYLSQRIVMMSGQPGRIVSDIQIPADYPRGDTFRASTLYYEFCRLIFAELGRAMSVSAKED
jgi:NitT/TauT family transport system ATP-binding protein